MGRSKRIYILKEAAPFGVAFAMLSDKKAKNPLAAAGSKLMGLN